jgi:YVTN family beta-propeller protein
VSGVVAAGCVGTDGRAVSTGGDQEVAAEGDGTGDGSTGDAGTARGGRADETSAEATTTTTEPRPPADTLVMQKYRRIGGDISPKSVVASGHGVVTAQNMMYTHTVTAYDSDGELLATIPDTVVLTDFGIDKPGTYKGSPVEAAFTPDGSKVYVSNYSMYGPGFSEGKDSCSPGDGTTTSFLHRIDTKSWKIDQVIPAGAVPKYVAVTPDGSKVLATNWCTWDLTIADTGTGQVLNTVKLGGRYPRGIAVTRDSRTAYVTIMGGTDVAKVDIATGAISRIRGVGAGPRHAVLAPDDRALYVTLNKAGQVAKIDTATGQVVARVATGTQPRSADISTDGTALYVVNYENSNISKIRTSDMTVLTKEAAGHHPIGIAYDDATGRVWVANYGGTIDIWDEVPAGTPPTDPGAAGATTTTAATSAAPRTGAGAGD